MHTGRVQSSCELPATSPFPLQRHGLAVLSGALSRASSPGSHLSLCSHLAMPLQTAPVSPAATPSCWLVLGLGHTKNLTFKPEILLPGKKKKKIPNSSNSPFPKRSPPRPLWSQEGAWEAAFEVRLHFSPLPSEQAHVFRGVGASRWLREEPVVALGYHVSAGEPHILSLAGVPHCSVS